MFSHENIIKVNGRYSDKYHAMVVRPLTTLCDGRAFNLIYLKLWSHRPWVTLYVRPPAIMNGRSLGVREPSWRGGGGDQSCVMVWCYTTSTRGKERRLGGFWSCSTTCLRCLYNNRLTSCDVADVCTICSHVKGGSRGVHGVRTPFFGERTPLFSIGPPPCVCVYTKTVTFTMTKIK